MPRSYGRTAHRPTANEVTERTDSNRAPTTHGPEPRSLRPPQGVSAVALLAAVAVVALSAGVPRTALVEAGTYLAPLALFLGLLSTTDTLAGR